MEDTEVSFGVRAKIAQDLLDRAGLIATQVHQIVPTTEDPVMRFFEGIFSDPNNWMETRRQIRGQRSRATRTAVLISTTPNRRKSRKRRSSSRAVTNKEQDHQCRTSTRRMRGPTSRADAVEVRLADQRSVAQAD
jgi:hypothetical protein